MPLLRTSASDVTRFRKLDALTAVSTSTPNPRTTQPVTPVLSQIITSVVRASTVGQVVSARNTILGRGRQVVIVTLPSMTATNGTDSAVVKYDEDGTPLWAQRIGTDSNNDEIQDVRVDNAGNVYVTGTYQTTLTFFNGSAVVSGMTLTGTGLGSNNVFVAKYSPMGVPLWSRRLGSTSLDTSWAIAINRRTGAVYVTLTFETTSLLEPATIATLGGRDAVLVKYDTNGTFQWSRLIGGTNNDDPRAIAVDDREGVDDVYVGGSYAAAMTQPTLANAGGTDSFVLKYNGSGDIQWSTRIAGTSTDEIEGFAVDSTGHLYVIGSFAGAPSIFNPAGTSVFTLSNSGSSSVFVIKYNSSGTPLWEQTIRGGGNVNAHDIAVDDQGSVYALGRFSSTLTSPLSFNNSGFLSGFVIKYNTSGVFQWGRRISGEGMILPGGIAVDNQRNVIASGQFNTSLTSFPGTTLTSAGDSDGFLVKYDTNGNAVWARRIGGTDSDNAMGVAVSSTSRDVHTAVRFRGTIAISNRT